MTAYVDAAPAGGPVPAGGALLLGYSRAAARTRADQLSAFGRGPRDGAVTG
ncbi:hypothetical protein LY71_11118 [Geodermatophilus tzadiensis]|uniref:Uncharacterized protein n=1 Tax=Geodermatophilus tzadiensis TaxID=1137988 RepID=A0A2T0TQB7_9ACTN|nr:hypothetical protein [Geodermatophilus tzadiensis]PRY47839.1 hypothetical protein LY71_11118 [Geodermatophilus tzadiensis]